MPARHPRRLTSAVPAALAALAALAPAAANAGTTISLNAEAVNITTNHISGVAAALSIDTLGAGTADDVLIVSAGGDNSVSGCAAGPDPTTRRCTLGARDTVSWTFGSGPFTDNNVVADMDRPGVRMTTTVAAGNALLAFDGSATTSSSNFLVTGVGSAKGGGGDDALSGTIDVNVLEGGAGDDALSGLKGWDTLRGGPGDDAITPGDGGSGNGTETAEGGEGTQDALSLADQKTAHAISFDGVANDGGAGHPLLISGFEAASGGEGDDTITGDAGFNHLYGLAGNDTVDGGGGGHDVLRGGPGADTIRARDASPLFGDIGCGGDADTAIVDVADLVAPDCETVDRAAAPAGFTATGAPDTAAPGVTVGGRSSVTRAGLLKGLTIPVTVGEPATIAVELLVRARRVASAAAAGDLVIAAASPRAVSGTASTRLRPSKSLLARARTATIRVTAVDAAGNRAVVSRKLKVTDPAPKRKRRQAAAAAAGAAPTRSARPGA